MPLRLPQEKNYELAPSGVHTATCNRVVDMGTQDSNFGRKHTIWISWELVDQKTSSGKPFSIGRRYTWSAAKMAALRRDLESWLNRSLSADDFGQLDLTSLLERTATLVIRHEQSDRGPRAIITSVLPPQTGTPARLVPEAGSLSLSLDDRPFDEASFEALPEWMRAAIATSPEYQNAAGLEPAPRRVVPFSRPQPRDELDDEIPF